VFKLISMPKWYISEDIFWSPSELQEKIRERNLETIYWKLTSALHSFH
jgi:hypothetical protein